MYYSHPTVQSQHLPGETEKNHKTLDREIQRLRQYIIPGPPKMRSKVRSNTSLQSIRNLSWFYLDSSVEC
jgi:hypothetical protein